MGRHTQLNDGDTEEHPCQEGTDVLGYKGVSNVEGRCDDGTYNGADAMNKEASSADNIL